MHPSEDPNILWNQIRELERLLAETRLKLDGMTQHWEKLATENAQLKRDAVTLTAGAGNICEDLRQRVNALELELVLARGGTATQKPGQA